MAFPKTYLPARPKVTSPAVQKFFAPLSCLHCSPGRSRGTLGYSLGGEDEILCSSAAAPGVMGISNVTNTTSWAENVITSLMNVGATNTASPSVAGEPLAPDASPSASPRSHAPYANHAGTFPRANGQMAVAKAARPQSTLTGLTGNGARLSKGGRAGATEEEDYDEPLYDSVASDEESNVDAISLGTKMSEGSRRSAASRVGLSVKNLSEDEKPSEGNALPTDDDSCPPAVPVEKYLALKEALTLSDTRVQQLLISNRDLKQEIALLQNMVRKLVHENVSLRKMKGIEGAPSLLGALVPHISEGEQHDDYAHIEGTENPSRASKPNQNRAQGERTPPSAPLASRSHLTVANDSGIRLSVGGVSDYDNTSPTHSCHVTSPAADRASLAADEAIGEAATTADVQVIKRNSHEYLPREEDVVRKTEKITRKIQELLLAAQDGREAAYGPCAEKIYLAVRDMAALFPERPNSVAICQALHALTGSAARLQVQCHDHALASANLSLEAPLAADGSPEPESRDLEEDDPDAMTSSTASTTAPYTQAVIQCAYEIAKAAKKLVTEFQ